MARRTRSVASRRGAAGGRPRRTGRTGGRRGLLVALLLASACAAAIFGLSRLDRRAGPVAGGQDSSLPTGGIPGIEEPEPPPNPATRAATTAATSAGRATAPSAASGPAAEPPPVLASATRPPSAESRAPAGDHAPPAAARRGLPRVAIVLDDCGQRLDLLERAVRVRQPLTFAVIPHLPHSRASAESAFAAGHEVIVHQPMEPESGEENPGEGVLLTGMSRADIRRTLKGSLAAVPHAVGLNNHMGSRATADPALMADVLSAVADLGRGRRLYFLDSRTSSETVAEPAARAAGVPAARRDVFLDNDLDEAAILAQVERLLAQAEEQGQAVGIGHLKPETLGVLESAMPRAEGRQARFVFLGDLVR